MKALAPIGVAALLLTPASALAQETLDTSFADSTVAQAGLPPVEGTDIPSGKPLGPDASATHDGAAHAGSASVDTHTSADFSEAQIDGYVTAAMAVQEMQADTTLDATAQQDRAASILAGAGLDAATFNAISDAVRSDPEVAERVQLAIANRRGSPGA